MAIRPYTLTIHGKRLKTDAPLQYYPCRVRQLEHLLYMGNALKLTHPTIPF